MSKLYSLTSYYVGNEYLQEQFRGYFTSPEKAIEYVYWTMVYQVYRGYTDTISQIIWRNHSNVQWSGYNPENGVKDPKDRGMPIYQIAIQSPDYEYHEKEKLDEFVQEKSLPRLNDVMRVVDYLNREEHNAT